MKKILTLGCILALSTNLCFAYGEYTKAFKKAVRQDIQNTRNSYREAVKKDLEANQSAQVKAAQERKAQRIKDIDNKIKDLNKEKREINNSKDMTYTEKLFKTRSIDRQIEYYNNQKNAIK